MSLFTKIHNILNSMADEIYQVLQQALQRNTKSTVLKSLGGLIAMLSAATILASRFGLDKWLVLMFAILDCLAIIAFIGFFCFFALTNPDLLRSEKFTIQKMAIQHGLIGDDISGMFKIPKVGDMPLIEDVASGQKNKDDK